jgi:hypothetical protein
MALQHSPQVILDGLVLSLDAANARSYPGTGTSWNDLSLNKNNATLVGPTYQTTDGGRFNFDGNNDYVNNLGTALSDSFWQAKWTASFWIRFDTISTTTTESNDKVILEHGTNLTGLGLKLFNRNSKVRITLTGTSGYALSSNSTISAGTWYNFVWTLNDSTRGAEVYLNGSSDNSTTLTNSYLGTGSNTQIGDGSLPGLPFDGQMGKCDFYNRVLTAAEIKQNYDAHRGRYGI